MVLKHETADGVNGLAVTVTADCAQHFWEALDLSRWKVAIFWQQRQQLVLHRHDGWEAAVEVHHKRCSLVLSTRTIAEWQRGVPTNSLSARP